MKIRTNLTMNNLYCMVVLTILATACGYDGPYKEQALKIADYEQTIDMAKYDLDFKTISVEKVGTISYRDTAQIIAQEAVEKLKEAISLVSSTKKDCEGRKYSVQSFWYKPNKAQIKKYGDAKDKLNEILESISQIISNDLEKGFENSLESEIIKVIDEIDNAASLTPVGSNRGSSEIYETIVLLRESNEYLNKAKLGDLDILQCTYSMKDLLGNKIVSKTDRYLFLNGSEFDRKLNY